MLRHIRLNKVLQWKIIFPKAGLSSTQDTFQ